MEKRIEYTMKEILSKKEIRAYKFEQEPKAGQTIPFSHVFEILVPFF
jgi:hypothetical protein